MRMSRSRVNGSKPVTSTRFSPLPTGYRRSLCPREVRSSSPSSACRCRSARANPGSQARSSRVIPSRAQYSGRSSSLLRSPPAGPRPCTRSTARRHRASPARTTTRRASAYEPAPRRSRANAGATVSNPERRRISRGASRSSRCSSTVGEGAGCGGGAAVAVAGAAIPATRASPSTPARIRREFKAVRVLPSPWGASAGRAQYGVTEVTCATGRFGPRRAGRRFRPRRAGPGSPGRPRHVHRFRVQQPLVLQTVEDRHDQRRRPLGRQPARQPVAVLGAQQIRHVGTHPLVTLGEERAGRMAVRDALPEQRRERLDDRRPHRVVLDQGGQQVQPEPLGRQRVPAVALVQDRHQQRFLGREVVQQPLLGEADPLRHGGQARAPVTALGDHLQGGPHDLRAPFLASGPGRHGVTVRHHARPAERFVTLT